MFMVLLLRLGSQWQAVLDGEMVAWDEVSAPPCGR